MNVVRIDFTSRQNFFNLYNTSSSCNRNIGIEVTSSFSELNIAFDICFPCLYDWKVSRNGFFHNVISSIEHLAFTTGSWDHSWLTISTQLDWETTLLNNSSCTSWCVESSYSCSSCSKSFSQSSLGNELNFELTSEVLLFKIFVFTDIRAFHALNLTIFKHKSKTKIFDSTVVRYDSMVFCSLLN